MSDRTSQSTPTLDAQPDLEAQAAEWLIAREGETWSAAQEQAWLHWCGTSAAHRAAYAHAERTWAELAGLRLAPELLDTLEAAAAPDSEGAAGAAARGAQPAARRSARRGLWSGLAAAVLATVVLLGWNQADPMLSLAADHRTRVGELRELTLADGSRVHLGADSAIAVHFDVHERRLELLKGEALFDAAPLRNAEPGGERRPFVVIAAQGRTQALGTRFVVERLSSHTLVTGIEHQVAVAVGPAETGDTPRQRAVLSPGQAVRYDATGLGTVQPTDIEQATAWRHKMLVFDHTSLTDVVARLNRYEGGRIVVWGKPLAQRPVSGVFPVGDMQSSLQAIADELDAKLLNLPGVSVLY